ncbi:MAG: OB-fold nucleic acid binding domain-containing protein, partial [Terriglobia bacterium]
MALSLDAPLTVLPGVGPQRARVLKQKGLTSVEDLLYYLPFRYEDRTRFIAIGDVQPGQVVCVQGEVKVRQLVRLRGRRGLFHLVVDDGTGLLYAKWFYGDYLERVFHRGQRVVLYGKVEEDRYRPGQLQMINPQHEVLSPLPQAGSARGGRADSTESGRLVPIYEAAGPVSPRVFRRLVYDALQRLPAALP